MVVRGVPLATIGRISRYAARKIHRVTLKDLVHHMRGVYRAGDALAFVNMTHWLQEELQVRFAHQLMDYYRQPYMVMMCEPFAKVHDTHLTTFEVISRFREVQAGKDVIDFAHTLRYEFQQHMETVQLLRSGLVQLRHLAGPDEHRQLHRFLDRFIVTKIGNRVLAENFVNWVDRVESGNEAMTSPGVVNECRLAPLVREIAEDIRALARDIFGRSPKVLLEDSMDTEVLIIPSHLQFILQEVLKNAVSATMERYAGVEEQGLPPVQDGGAVPGLDDDNHGLRTQLSGYGIGVPISRLFARYFGGELILNSVYGFGTDVSIRLNRLGDHVELGCSADDSDEDEDGEVEQ